MELDQPWHAQWFLCAECKRVFATKDPDEFFWARVEEDDDGTKRHYCECGRLLSTTWPTGRLAS